MSEIFWIQQISNWNGIYFILKISENQNMTKKKKKNNNNK